MRLRFIAALLLAPFAANAAPCRYEAPRHLQLDLASIGSGDVVLRKVGGSVHVDTLGSGDFSVSDVAADFSLGAKGSGDVSHSGVKGSVDVPHDDD